MRERPAWMECTPPEYQIPKFHGVSKAKEYEDNSLLILNPDKKGWVTAESANGSFVVKEPADFLRLFSSKYNWTSANQNELHCLFKVFNRRQLQDLDWFGKLEFENHQVHWMIGSGKIRITTNNYTKSSRFLINVSSFQGRNHQATSLDDLQTVVDEILTHHKTISINPASYPSTVQDLVLSRAQREFWLYNRLHLIETRFIHAGYIPPRMESRCLGTIDGVSRIDMEKAFLRKLALCPSTAKENIVFIARGGKYDEEAHPGSTYEIEATVPETYRAFPPLPMRSGKHIYYPTGTFQTIVPKPFIDTIIKAGDIPFKIINSIQFLQSPRTPRPFAKLAKEIEMFENGHSADLPHLNLKGLHTTIIGHMLHIHLTRTEVDGKPFSYYETSRDYNPAIASAVSAMVACEIWEGTQVEDSEAIHVDARSGYGLKDIDGYKKSDEGRMTFLTPYLKDKPGETTYRDLIHLWRDERRPWVSFPYRKTIRQAQYYPHLIGNLTDSHIPLPPSPAGRILRDDIKMVGSLLDRRIPTFIPQSDTDMGNQQESPAWVDKYIRLYPQT